MSALDDVLALLKGSFKLNKIEVIGGSVKISALYDAQGIDVELSVLVGFELFLELLKKLIPGNFDDLFIDMMEAALKGKPK